MYGVSVHVQSGTVSTVSERRDAQAVYMLNYTNAVLQTFCCMIPYCVILLLVALDYIQCNIQFIDNRATLRTLGRT